MRLDFNLFTRIVRVLHVAGENIGFERNRQFPTINSIFVLDGRDISVIRKPTNSLSSP